MSFLLPLPLLLLLCPPESAQSTTAPPSTIAATAATGDWPRTQALARLALKTNPRDPTTWTYLGLAAGHLGQQQIALHDFAEAVRLAPDATYTHNNYGASLEATGKPKQALQEYRRSLALDRLQPAALINLARLLTANDDPKERSEAQELLRSAWELAPDPEVARSLLLLAPCASSAAPPSAPHPDLAAYARAVAESPAAVPEAEQYRVGRSLLQCGFNDGALTYYGAILTANPDDAEAIAGKAETQLASGNARDAGLTLETAVAAGSKSPTIYAELANVYQRTGHMDHAVDALRTALELAPQDDRLQFRYGMLLLDAHAPRAAEVRMRQALQRTPNSSKLWFVLGLAQFDDTEPAAAQVSFDRSIALDSAFAPAMAYRGLAALDQQQYTEAEHWYRRALAVSGDAADLHLLLAEALERQHPGESKEVRAELDRALAIDSSLAAAHLSLGRLNLGDGKPADAARELEAALVLDHTQRQAHFYLARAYRQLHQTDRAAAEAKLFSEQEATAQQADRTALQDALRQFAHTPF